MMLTKMSPLGFRQSLDEIQMWQMMGNGRPIYAKLDR